MISMGNSLPSFRRPYKLDSGADLLRQRFRRGPSAVGHQALREALRE